MIFSLKIVHYSNVISDITQNIGDLEFQPPFRKKDKIFKFFEKKLGKLKKKLNKLKFLKINKFISTRARNL
jgi:hypothetical protein